MNKYRNKKYKLGMLWLIFACISMSIVLKPASAVEEFSEIPLNNPGFELALTDWNVGAFKEQVTVETNNVRNGAQALNIDAFQKYNQPFVYQTATDLRGGATYQFSVWARVAPGSPATVAAVKMENYNTVGKNTNGLYGQLSLPADGSWKQVKVSMRLDADIVSSRLYVRVMGASAIIFDDATFAMLKMPSEITVVSPQRQVLLPGQASSLSYQLYLRQPWVGDQPPEITASLQPVEASENSSNDIIRAIVKQAGDNRNFTASFAIPKLSDADYQINFSYKRDGKLLESDVPAFIFTEVPRRKPAYLTDTGTILRNGRPFFPIGMYHPDKGVEDYKLLSENGFNAVQGSGPMDLQQFKTILDNAQKYGMAVDVPLYLGNQVAKNMESSLEKIKNFADHPAVLTWKIIDEPEHRPEMIHEVPPAYRTLKAAEAKNPIELTMSGSASLDFWSNFCDILQLDHYPLPHSPLTEVSDKAREAVKLMQPWQNLSFVLQSGWRKDLSNQPSVAQARSMVYLALIEGAKGIWWYSMRESSGWDLTKTPLWPHMKDINAEIKSLSEPLMSGKVVDGVSCDQPKVLFRAVEYQNKTYLLITNPGDEPVQASFTLPQNLRSWHQLDSDTASTMKDQKLVLSLQGIDSLTIVLEK